MGLVYQGDTGKLEDRKELFITNFNTAEFAKATKINLIGILHCINWAVF
jgi:hypothetical protein